MAMGKGFVLYEIGAANIFLSPWTPQMTMLAIDIGWVY